MTEMIDRVARAIALREAEIMLGADRSQQAADPRELARAAIEAMREPTPGMLPAGFLADEGCVMPGQTYRAMINAALSPS